VSIFLSMMQLKWQGAWLILLLLGVVGFVADSADQPTLVPWGAIASDENRDDVERETQSAPARAATARSHVVFSPRRKPSASLALLTRGLRIAPSNLNARKTPSRQALTSDTPTLVALRL